MSIIKKPRILILSQYYPPESGAPQARLSALATSLQTNGFSVTVLTAMPSYPTGRIFSGYRSLFRKEWVDNIHIIRSFIIPTRNASMIPRLVSYFSFAISSFLASLFLPKVDIVLTESPPLFLGITGWITSRLKRAHWIFNISDLWPLSAAELNAIDENGWAYRLSEKLEGFLYQKAWLISGQSKSILENIRQRFPQVKTYLFSNGADTRKFETTPTIHKPNEMLVVYAGLHGLAQGLEQIIKAAKILEDQPGIKFQLIGDGPTKEELVLLARKVELPNLTFLETVSAAEIPAILKKADVILVPLKTQLTGAIPSKMFEAMAAGRPVIFIGSGEGEQIVSNNKCGFCVPPGRVDLLVESIKALNDNPEIRLAMGKNGRETVNRDFDKLKICEGFAKFLLTKVS